MFLSHNSYLNFKLALLCYIGNSGSKHTEGGGLHKIQLCIINKLLIWYPYCQLREKLIPIFLLQWKRNPPLPFCTHIIPVWKIICRKGSPLWIWNWRSEYLDTWEMKIILTTVSFISYGVAWVWMKSCGNFNALRLTNLPEAWRYKL